MSHSIGPTPVEPAWDDVFELTVDNDDHLWKNYLEEADKFDKHMIEDWIKIVDVILVYVALFTAVLTAFIIGTANQFTRDPAAISNDLLVAIYGQVVAISNNSTAPVIDTSTLFKQDPAALADAIYSNALLFASLAIAIVVSTIALTVKLWIVTYDNRVSAPGSPYERAMKRQRTYNGLLKWKMDALIHSFPLLVLLSVILFGIFINHSIGADQTAIGFVVGILFLLGLALLLLASFCGAFIPNCPYNSTFSYFVKLVFKSFPNFTAKAWMGKTLVDMKPSLGRVISITGVSVGFTVATFVLVVRYSQAFYVLFCFPIAGVFALMGKPEKTKRRPRRYELPEWILISTINITLIMSLAGYFSGGMSPMTFNILFWIGSFLLFIQGIFGIRMSGTVSDTTEADAIAWLLKSTSSWEPGYIEKTGQIARHSKGHPDATKAILLKSLLPLLSALITSHKVDEENEKSYVACLALLASFKDDTGSIWKNEAAITHPLLPQTLMERLIEIKASPKKTQAIHNAATRALQSFGLGEEAPKRTSDV